MNDNGVPYSTMEILQHSIGAIVVVSIVLWVGIGFRLWKMARTKPTALENVHAELNPAELVSIIVPVHNEERVIEKCAHSLRGQTHKNLQLIFVLDRCNDGTKSILERHASEDDRVCIVENNFCPDDWAGKCHAAKLGADKADGNWLLFTDADTEFDTRLVSSTVSSAIDRKADLLSLLSSLTITKVFERIVQPIASTFLVRQFPVDRVNREKRSRPFANGQFLLFSKEAYERIGGHTAVKDDLLEDIAFARLVHRNDMKVQMLFADGLLRCSMYPSFSAFTRGWKRIFIEASSRNVPRLVRSGVLVLLVTLFLPAINVTGVVVGAQASTALLWSSVASLAIMLVVISWLYCINNAPVMYVVFAPLGGLVVAKLFFDASFILKNRTPIEWGGKTYIVEPRHE